jgi:carboxyvinyl-carboxyphosphonate phosphorylmutase
MRWSQRREAFRALLAGRACIHPASVFDPISARIAEDLGFEAGMFAGSVAATTILGGPDLITITLSEFADQAHRICRAGNLPLLVDADHGYGNALNVMRTVEELETAGIAGLSIEDTLLPEPFGPSKAARLLPLEEGLGKMRAALAARRDPKLVIAGRTSAAMLTTTEDAIARATAYQDAGVDAIFLVGVKTRAQMDAIAEAVTLPMIVGGVGAEVMDRDYLATRGVRVCLQGHQPFAAAVQAVHDTLKALRDGVAPRDLKGVASNELMNRVTRNAEYQAWMKDFLGKD